MVSRRTALDTRPRAAPRRAPTDSREEVAASMPLERFGYGVAGRRREAGRCSRTTGTEAPDRGRTHAAQLATRRGTGRLPRSIAHPPRRAMPTRNGRSARPRRRSGRSPVRRYTAEERDCFYDAVCRRIERAVLGADTWRARRMAEREAIFAELEERGLIRRTRGGAISPPPKEGVLS